MSKIISLLLPLFLIVMGVQFSRDYFGDTTKERRAQLENLVANGEQTTGIVADEYTEKTIKIAKVPIKTYEIDYVFEVGDQEFTGKKALTSPPTEPTVQVSYLPSDPSINEVDPQEAIASLDDTESDSMVLLLGIGLILAGLGLGFYRYRSMQKEKIA